MARSNSPSSPGTKRRLLVGGNDDPVRNNATRSNPEFDSVVSHLRGSYCVGRYGTLEDYVRGSQLSHGDVQMNDLRVLMLDGVSSSNIEKFGLVALDEIMEEYGGHELSIATFPMTIPSQTMMWSGSETDMMNWLYPEDEEPGTQELIDLEEWEEDPSAAVEGYELLQRKDYDPVFIWELLESEGYETVVDGVPLLLPPIVHNVDQKMVDVNWFPAGMEELDEHLRAKRKSLEYHCMRDVDFYCTVVQVPDKWEHLLQEKDLGVLDVAKQVSMVNGMVDTFVHICEMMDHDWVIVGDHGSPDPDNPELHEDSSVIVSNLENTPESNEQFHNWMLSQFEGDWETERNLKTIPGQFSQNAKVESARRIIE